MFAGRTRWDLAPNRIAQETQRLRGRGVRLLDLTESNPTKAGILYPKEILRTLSDQRGLVYDPDPKGDPAARQAVASIYTGKGVPVDPGRIILTASTSEAYGFLFRLIANPGDQVMIPRPSYPLVGYLAGLNDLETVSYPWVRKGTGIWEIDWSRLEKAATPRCRALVAVHPNNPTGSCFRQEETERLSRFCRRRAMAMISDEVFAEYRFSSDPAVSKTLLSPAGPLCFSLGGLSKFMGLPQMKLAWIVCSGPAGQADLAMEKLEMIADTALSVNTPVQRAFPGWLKFAPGLQEQIRKRIEENRRFLEQFSGNSFRPLPSEGGWSAMIQVPSARDEEAWAFRLLQQAHVQVHPGYLFDFEEPRYLVVSLLRPLELFREAVRRMAAHAP